MKRIALIIAVFALLIGNYAYAKTYTYTGDNFTTVSGAYTTSMRVTGTLVTSSPIPPNSVGIDISGILTSWSFSDGVQTITSADGEFSPIYPPLVVTDGQGVITDSFLAVFSSPLATTVGGTDDLIAVYLGLSQGAINLVCDSVTDGFCDSYSEPDSYGLAESYGAWGGATSIPTLSQWSLILLALMLGVVGITRARRQV